MRSINRESLSLNYKNPWIEPWILQEIRALLKQREYLFLIDQVSNIINTMSQQVTN